MPTIRFDRKPPGVDTVEWYKDATGAFTAGYWTHEGGTLEVGATPSTSSASCWQARSAFTDQDGHVDEYGMGDRFCDPDGVQRGTWETLKPVRKWYVIWQPGG